jgi:hypothetical protein
VKLKIYNELSLHPSFSIGFEQRILLDSKYYLTSTAEEKKTIFPSFVYRLILIKLPFISIVSFLCKGFGYKNAFFVWLVFLGNTGV